MAQWLEREFTDREVCGSNPTSASRLPLSRLGQPGIIPALVLPPGSMAVRRRKGATAERTKAHFTLQSKRPQHCNTQVGGKKSDLHPSKNPQHGLIKNNIRRKTSYLA
ncbi:hypothetical protein CSKR_104604 [Clonorchis sinensis]|uniref:Uncharacterized protein n=1 Tax=Clonorchis sinensis TaxID=79923 RepID=A0A419PLW5_CLOSI|nr:hypothetical protein CSKR_104604 [Clonorchis sinensis]